MIQGLRRVMRGEADIDFIGRTKLWATISAVVLGVSIGGLFIQKLNLGLEFKGGTSLTVPTKTEVTVVEVEDVLDPLEIGEVDVQLLAKGQADERILVRAKRVPPDKLATVRTELAKAVGQVDANGVPNLDEVNTEDVGPSWGRQVSNKALRALIVFIILVMLYISLRFEPKMAAGALAALIHDLMATAGIYAIVGFEVTPATVIALLTLMGFSLYDTVVVFDRIRENAAGLAPSSKTTYSDMVNASVNEVLIRSINTSLTSVLPVAGLLFVGVLLFGAVTLKDLALAMFVGTLVSTYSSIFVAAPILAVLKEREPRYRALRARAGTGRAGRFAPLPAGAGPALAERVEAEAAPSVVTTVGSGARPAPRPRKRKRGKRR